MLDAPVVFLNQRERIDKLQSLDDTKADAAAHNSQRTRGAYIATVCRPDLSFGFSVCAQVIQLTARDAKHLSKITGEAKAHVEIELRFISTDEQTVRMAIFADAILASIVDLTLQLGFDIATVDARNNSSIVHYSSLKSKRVTRSCV